MYRPLHLQCHIDPIEVNEGRTRYWICPFPYILHVVLRLVAGWVLFVWCVLLYFVMFCVCLLFVISLVFVSPSFMLKSVAKFRFKFVVWCWCLIIVLVMVPTQFIVTTHSMLHVLPWGTVSLSIHAQFVCVIMTDSSLPGVIMSVGYQVEIKSN